MPLTPLSASLCAMFAVGIGVNNLMFWLQIYPVLERSGHIYNPMTIRKFENGFFRTLYKYKEVLISENKPLTWWWSFLASLWTGFVGLAGLVILILLNG